MNIEQIKLLFDIQPIRLSKEQCETVMNYVVELEKERITLLSCLLGISNQCIGEIAMNYTLDAEMIGESIYAATGKTNPELAKAIKGSK